MAPNSARLANLNFQNALRPPPCRRRVKRREDNTQPIESVDHDVSDLFMFAFWILVIYVVSTATIQHNRRPSIRP